MLMPKFYCVIDEICMFMYHVNKGVVAARCYDMLVIKKKDKFHVQIKGQWTTMFGQEEEGETMKETPLCDPQRDQTWCGNDILV